VRTVKTEVVFGRVSCETQCDTSESILTFSRDGESMVRQRWWKQGKGKLVKIPIPRDGLF
jgi:hypothetical protein